MTHPICKLFRWKPVAAWGAVGILIAASCAVSSGLPVDWLNLLLVGITILIVQGIIAHSVNDLADEDVDRIAPIEATGRSKVLVSGDMTRRSVLAITSAAGIIVFLIIIMLAMRAGPIVFLFAAFALYAVFGYSCKPLKLGWRPASEITVVVPVITVMICGVEYVMIGTVTLTAIYIGISYGFFNASWFMYSRAQDYEADRVMGKNTTIVRYGLATTPNFAATHLFFGGIFAFLAAIMSGWFTGLMIMLAYIVPAFDYVIKMGTESRKKRRQPRTAGKGDRFVMVSDLHPEICADMRTKGMMLAATYGVFASLGILIGGII